MSNYLSTTWGKIRGKHGTAVGIVRNGKAIMRVFTPPSNPNTEAQQSQRMKFGLVLFILNALRQAINAGFGRKGFYQAVSWALGNAVTGEFPDFSVDYSKVKVSSGALARSMNASVTLGTGNMATIDWESGVWAGGSADDRVHVVFLDSAANIARYFDTGLKRQDGQFATSLAMVEPGSTLHVWLFFSDAAQCSDSQYLGTVVVQ